MEAAFARTLRVGLSLFFLVAMPAAVLAFVEKPLHARAGSIAATCVVLWLSELIPLYATTLVFWVLSALFLGPFGKEYSLGAVLAWSASPVLALFFGGFALCVAGEKYGIDRKISNALVRLSRGKRRLLLFNVMLGTAVLSMWMSNIAAAAMMLGALGTLFKNLPEDDPFRKAMLLGVAFAGDFGGMATPIGTGSNAIAIAAIEKHRHVGFLEWMVFAVPLTAVMLALAYALLTLRYGVSGSFQTEATASDEPHKKSCPGVVVVFACAVAAWLSEPLHGIPAPAVALLAAASLFAFGLLESSDLPRLDWSTMVLIAGGLALGEMLERSGLANRLAAAMNWEGVSSFIFLLMFIAVAALLSAVASNTAAAALLIPIGMSVDPSYHFAILVALGTSMGVPFVISTPPNAMAYGKGGLKPLDLLIPGAILAVVGCVLIAATGPWVLKLLLK